jgi:hypothetical protein
MMSVRIGQSSSFDFNAGQPATDQPGAGSLPEGPRDGVDAPDFGGQGGDATILFSTAAPAPPPAPAQTPAPSGNQPAQTAPTDGKKEGDGKGKGEGDGKSLNDKMKSVIDRIGPDGFDVGNGVSVGGSLSPPMIKVTFKF